MKYYQRWVSDYIADTGHLSLLEHGVYTVLLDHVYYTEKPLPKDRDAIYRLTRAFAQEERAAVDSVLNQFFTEGADGWRNGRADREMARTTEIGERKTEHARKAARARWDRDADAMHEHSPSNAPGNADGYADAMHTTLHTPHSTLHTPDSKEKPSSSAAPTRKLFPPEFEAIWSAKPARTGSNPKVDALHAYNGALKRGHTAEQMLAGVKRYAAFLEHTRKIGTPYVLRLSTFLGPNNHFAEPWSTEGVKVDAKPDNVLFQRGKAFS